MQKRITALFFPIIIALCISSGCATAQTVLPKKVLIVYLSRTNNTKAIAEVIRKNVGGTLVSLELEKPYPENYQATVQQVAKENETCFLPPLKTKIDSIEKYDAVFLGFPNMGHDDATTHEKFFYINIILQEKQLFLLIQTLDMVLDPVLKP